jgi:NitT/TauT family transport system ATP-binding protein
VVVLSAGPRRVRIGEFAIDLPRPRDVAVRMTPRFVHFTGHLARMKDEVLKGYAQSRAMP